MDVFGTLLFDIHLCVRVWLPQLSLSVVRALESACVFFPSLSYTRVHDAYDVAHSRNDAGFDIDVHI